jgi:malate dehydrogenase
MDVSIFGNHSATQVPYARTATVRVKGEIVPITNYLSVAEIDSLAPKVQKRGAAVMNAQQASSGMSAAAAIAKHIKSWVGPIPPSNEMFSMGIMSDGNTYGVPDGLCFSFPCRRVIGAEPGTVEIVTGLEIDATIQAMIDLTTTELNEEKAEALSILDAPRT